MPLEISTLPISAILPADYNPRKDLQPGDAEYEKLKASIEKFGYVELVVVNKRNDYTAISGHQRLKVLADLGIQEIECVVVDLDENQEKADRVCYAMELDPKYASVILRRYAEATGDAAEITCEREGKQYDYLDLVKEVDRPKQKG